MRKKNKLCGEKMYVSFLCENQKNWQICILVNNLHHFKTKRFHTPYVLFSEIRKEILSVKFRRKFYKNFGKNNLLFKCFQNLLQNSFFKNFILLFRRYFCHKSVESCLKKEKNNNNIFNLLNFEISYQVYLVDRFHY